LTTESFIYQFAEKFNGITFQRFLCFLLKKFKKLIIVIDHAPYHVSKKMQRFYDIHEDHLHVEYFPSYSPELNPAEQPWREVKKWLATSCWTGKEGLLEQLISAFQQDFVIAPIYDYLLP
jgi:transposase